MPTGRPLEVLCSVVVVLCFLVGVEVVVLQEWTVVKHSPPQVAMVLVEVTVTVTVSCVARTVARLCRVSGCRYERNWKRTDLAPRMVRNFMLAERLRAKLNESDAEDDEFSFSRLLRKALSIYMYIRECVDSYK